MTLKNKYLYHSRVTEWKFRQILGLFCEDLDATKIASFTKVQRKTVNRMVNELPRSKLHGIFGKQRKFFLAPSSVQQAGRFLGDAK